MIKRVKGGYQVFSESGKPLSKPGLRRSEAEHRLAQVEYYKNLNAAAAPKKRKK